jgi:hypothetical protein
MREITEYKVLQTGRLDTFQEAIDQAIKDGWQPYGELLPPTFWWGRFTQVVVKYK